jgi:uncharacterized damage-inducible protein DinB
MASDALKFFPIHRFSLSFQKTKIWMENEIKELLEGWQAHTEAVLQRLDALDRSADLQKQEGGGWSLIDTLEHLFISEKGASRLMLGAYEDKNVDWRAFQAMVSNEFVGNPKRFQAPEQLGPQGRFADYATWRQAFVANREVMAKLLQDLGPNGFVNTWEHPFFGYMTRAQWLIFSKAHFDRHLSILKV